MIYLNNIYIYIQYITMLDSILINSVDSSMCLYFENARETDKWFRYTKAKQINLF
jgi:hypothetical protein